MRNEGLNNMKNERLNNGDAIDVEVVKKSQPKIDYSRPLNIMVNGTPGKMGISVSEAVIARGGNVNLVPFSLTGENIDTSEPFDISGK